MWTNWLLSVEGRRRLDLLNAVKVGIKSTVEET